ncbi:aspartate aminotransferase family protein [Conexibacter sp. SYSU D00693]|uniref:aspartate aminotransferase family protein n=1 Tax=Conexibacter sp. SYSU D00693 TaxID=2812560 RepID=UPI00196AB833|nr:acetylornithine/succinylornithine family transaminase [Conexibacter sp. SYSU D00693]
MAINDDFLTANYARHPVELVRGEGARLWDAADAEYLDFLSGISVSNVGHCHPQVVAAIQEQSQRLLHVGNLFYTDPMVRLAERLAKGSLGGKVFFTNSGAEAVEAALKLARKNRRGGEVISFHGAFHGRTYGALSATPQESKQAPFAPLVPGFRAIPPTVEAIRHAVTDDTAAVVIEPVQGETGVRPIPVEVLRAAREACDVTGAALVFDEIQAGLGRCGSLWCWQQVGVEPDLLLTAKALAGGLPIGALITGPGLADVFEPGDHGSTFAGGPLVCAAAHAALDVLEDEALHARVRALGERLRAALRELPGAKDVRGLGLMNAFDLEAGGAPELVRRAVVEQRLLLNATGPDTVRLLPPLVVSEEQVDDAVGRLRALLA